MGRPTREQVAAGYWLAATDGSAIAEPHIQLKLRGISVVMKPPNWEVDAKGAMSTCGRHLSEYMMCEHGPSARVLGLTDFEHGLVHRLDLPSSGLILAGTTFEGYCLLQWQMHTYTILREYVVLVSGLVPSGLRTINMPIDDFFPGRSIVSNTGRPASSHVRAILHCTRRQRLRSGEQLCLICIAIHT